MACARRTLWPAAALALLTGCGSSVAQADVVPASPFCAAVRADADALAPLGGLSLAGPINAAGDGLTATVTSARIAGTALVDAAPGEVRVDVQQVVDAMDVELNALVVAGGDAARAAATAVSPDVTAAQQRFAAYVRRNCGVTA